LTVPVKFKFGTKIKDILIDNSHNWKKKHLGTLKACYGKAPYFHQVMEVINCCYSKDFKYLLDLNLCLLESLIDKLDLQVKTILSSEIEKPSNVKSTELLIFLVKSVGGKIYLSGKGGKKYQDEEKFKKEGLHLIYIKYPEFKYSQLGNQFLEGLSVLDALFNIGFKATSKMLHNLEGKDESPNGRGNKT
jgi:hypothetical protein